MNVGSSQSIAEGDLVLATKATLTGDFSDCDQGTVDVSLPDRALPGSNSGFLAAWTIDGGQIVTSDADAVIPTQWTQGPSAPGAPGLSIFASCRTVTGGGGGGSGSSSPSPTPAFDISVTFTWTKAPPKVTFN